MFFLILDFLSLIPFIFMSNIRYIAVGGAKEPFFVINNRKDILEKNGAKEKEVKGSELRERQKCLHLLFSPEFSLLFSFLSFLISVFTFILPSFPSFIPFSSLFPFINSLCLFSCVSYQQLFDQQQKRRD